MKKHTVELTREETENVRRADAKVEVLEQIYRTFLETHLKNKDASFLETPIVKTYTQMVIDAKVAHNELVNNLLKKYTKDHFSIVDTWHINYFTEELTYVEIEEIDHE